MTGDSSPLITKDEVQSLRRIIDGETPTIDNVKHAIKKTGMSAKFGRHRWAILRMLGGPQIYNWDARDVMEIAKKFRVVECIWDKKKHRVFKGRKSFLSYKFVLYQLLSTMGLPVCPELLLKSHRLLENQRQAYARMSVYTKFKLYD